MDDKTEYKNAPDFRKFFSKACAVILCVLCAVVCIMALVMSLIAFSKNSENTAQIFGYKFYVSETDIEAADIESGSLIIVKNTEDDDFYTPEMLEDAIVVKNAGKIIKQSGALVVLCVLVPLMLLFIVVIFRELHKKIAHAPVETENVVISVDEEFEEQTE